MKHTSDKWRLRGVTSKRLLAQAGLYFLLLLSLAYLFYDHLFGPGEADRRRQTVILPALTGQTLDEATAALDSPAFHVTTVYLYDAEQPRGTVLRQTPAPGSVRKIAADGEPVEVRLTVSLGARRETVPDLRGKDGREARLLLESRGFSVVTKRRTSSFLGTPADRVIGTDPVAGRELTAGDTVTLYVSYPREEASVKCPTLVGLDRTEALAALRGAGLQPGEITTVHDEGAEAPTTFWSDDTVVSQGRPAGCWLPRGSRVDLTVRVSCPQFENIFPHQQKGINHPWIFRFSRPNFGGGSSNA